MSALPLLVLASRSRRRRRPAQPPAAPRSQLPYTQFTLPNGLHVILHEDHSVPVVTVNVWYHVGSAREQPGRTGFAHLFEHLMFMGSGHVKPGEFDELARGAPAATTTARPTNDRTNYWINVPSNALELALFLESDRMGYLLDTMTPETRRRAARRRQERAAAELREPPVRHGRHRARRDALSRRAIPTTGRSSATWTDLTAASYDDVVGVLQEVLRAGQRQPGGRRRHRHRRTRGARREVVRRREARAAPVEPMTMPGVDARPACTKKTITDRVQLPRLYLAWLTPRHLRAGRRRARRRGRRARRRQELAALQAARLRHADRAGRLARTSSRRRCRRRS